MANCLLIFSKIQTLFRFVDPFPRTKAICSQLGRVKGPDTDEWVLLGALKRLWGTPPTWMVRKKKLEPEPDLCSAKSKLRKWPLRTAIILSESSHQWVPSCPSSSPGKCSPSECKFLEFDLIRWFYMRSCAST